MSEAPSDAQQLKFHLLADGLIISRTAAEALQRFNGHRSLTPADYASTSGVILQLEHDIWVNAPIEQYNANFVANSSYRLEYDRTGFMVTGGGLSSAAKFWCPPQYHGMVADFGPINNYIFTHGDRARLSPLRGCAMTCRFCNIPYDDPISAYSTKPIEALIHAAKLALTDPFQPARHLLISGGTPKRRDVDFMRSVYREVLTTFPDVQVDIMMVPLAGLFDLIELDALGLNQISINMEIYNRERARHLMRNKYNQGREFYLDFIAEAADLLGPGRVRSMLMVGLEPLSDTLSGVRAIAERGGVPVLSPFRPDPATPLRNAAPPTAEQLCEAYLRAAEVVDNLGSSLGPSCSPCSHNTLSFSPTVAANQYGRAIPVMV